MDSNACHPLQTQQVSRDERDTISSHTNLVATVTVWGTRGCGYSGLSHEHMQDGSDGRKSAPCICRKRAENTQKWILIVSVMTQRRASIDVTSGACAGCTPRIESKKSQSAICSILINKMHWKIYSKRRRIHWARCHANPRQQHFHPPNTSVKGGNYAAIFISLDVPDSGVRMGIRGAGRFVSSIKVTQESSRMKKYETAKSRKVIKTDTSFPGDCNYHDS